MASSSAPMAVEHPADIIPAAAKMTYPDDPSFDSPQDSTRLEMPQDEVDAIIRNKRKARDPKACYACHRRKVKCDRNLPCDSCVKRDHPELCSYERPGKRRRIGLTGAVNNGNENNQLDGPDVYSQQSGPNVSVPKEQWERINQELQMLRDATKNTRLGMRDGLTDQEDADGGTVSRSDESEREGIHAPSDQMGTMHLGSRSVLAYMMGLGRSKATQEAAKTLLKENVLPKLGLDNETATYPFVDLWSTDNSMHDVSGLCKALPDDALCQEFFIAYRDIACTIYPVVADTTHFQSSLNLLLANRARAGGEERSIDPDHPYGVSMSWLALLFAVMASGAQSTSRPAKERELTSQVYICCSYQALRMANFLTHPCLEAIQAFLVIGNVLSYNMNPGVSYIFLGLTMRMAFSIGLQADSQSFSPSEQYLRSRIWWALAWQDSHFAVSYDRPTASAFCTPEIPYRKSSTPGQRSYAESMFRIIKLTQEIIRERTTNPRTTMNWSTIQSYRDEVERIVADAAPHIRDRNYCSITTQHLERLALKLHSSYITSELCRPALREPPLHPGGMADPTQNTHATPFHSPTTASTQHSRRRSSHQSAYSPTSSQMSNDPHLPASLRRDCVTNLERTVAAYVELHSLSEFAARSWIGIQRAVSAAFLLGTLYETSQNSRIHLLLRKLEQVIAQRTIEDLAFDSTGGADSSLVSPVVKRRKSSAENGLSLADSPHWAKSMSKSLKALGKLNKALGQQPPPVQTNNAMPALASKAPGIYGGGSSSGMGGATMSGGLPIPAYAPITNLKTENYSPSANPGIGVLSAITPDSTSSTGEWNYGNMTERALEFVSPALWG